MRKRLFAVVAAIFLFPFAYPHSALSWNWNALRLLVFRRRGFGFDIANSDDTKSQARLAAFHESGWAVGPICPSITAAAWAIPHRRDQRVKDGLPGERNLSLRLAPSKRRRRTRSPTHRSRSFR